MLLSPSQSDLMLGHEDDFMGAVSVQLKFLSEYDPLLDETVPKVYKSLLTAMNSVRQKKQLFRLMLLLK